MCFSGLTLCPTWCLHSALRRMRLHSLRRTVCDFFSELKKKTKKHPRGKKCVAFNCWLAFVYTPSAQVKHRRADFQSFSVKYTWSRLYCSVRFCRMELWHNREENTQPESEVIWRKLLLGQKDSKIRQIDSPSDRMDLFSWSLRNIVKFHFYRNLINVMQ